MASSSENPGENRILKDIESKAHSDKLKLYSVQNQAQAAARGTVLIQTTGTPEVRKKPQ
jgi:hypothetical protein